MYLFIDVGGTKIRFGLSKNGTDLDSIALFETPQSKANFFALISDQISSFTGVAQVKKIIVGVPGTIDETTGTVLKAAHLPFLDGLSFGSELRGLTTEGVVLQNDTALVGLGEATFGAGKGHGIVAYITISTGVGGVRIVRGQIDPSAYGYEIGHSLLDTEHDVEELISGTAIQNKFGKPPRDVLELAVWEEEEKLVARFLSTVMCFWSPHIIIVGGSMVRSISLSRVESLMRTLTPVYKNFPTVHYGQLGDYGGLYGGLALLQSQR